MANPSSTSFLTSPPALPSSVSADGAFLTTRWTRVRSAKHDSEDGRLALRDLCEAYYAPVVAYLRCRMRDEDQARESAHAFFATLLQSGGGTIHGADQNQGRFRSYLLGAVKHYLAHQWQAARRQKRGGGQADLPLDEHLSDVLADAGEITPDAAFDRQWAITVLSRSLDTLQAECTAEGRTAFFDAAKPHLMSDATYGDQTELAAACGLSTPAFRMPCIDSKSACGSG